MLAGFILISLSPRLSPQKMGGGEWRETRNEAIYSLLLHDLFDVLGEYKIDRNR